MLYFFSVRILCMSLYAAICGPLTNTTRLYVDGSVNKICLFPVLSKSLVIIIYLKQKRIANDGGQLCKVASDP